MFIKIKLLNISREKFSCTFSSIKPQNQLKVRDNGSAEEQQIVFFFVHHSKTWLSYKNLLSDLEHVDETN